MDIKRYLVSGETLCFIFGFLMATSPFSSTSSLPNTSTVVVQENVNSSTSSAQISRNHTISHDLNIKNIEALLNDKDLFSLLGNMDLASLGMIPNNETTEGGQTPSLPVIEISMDVLDEVFKKAEKSLVKRDQNIQKLWEKNEGADSKGTQGTAYAFTAPNEYSIALSNCSRILEMASKVFLSMQMEKGEKEEASEESPAREKRQINRFNALRQTAFDISQINVHPFLRSHASTPPINCGATEEHLPCDAHTPYRTFSGWCNNLRNPAWGKSVITFDRMLPPAYEDGISVPRMKSVTGAPLPYPRYISSTIHIDSSHLSNRHTLMFMQYAQFLDHDVTHTPVNRGPGGQILNCRDCESYKSSHPECWPISVPQGDSYYPHMNESTGMPYCIPFSRSLSGQQRLGPRDQINQNSAYIDSSHIYGENICKANQLRAPGGMLNATFNPRGKPFMPQITYLKECKSRTGYCFFAGDPRASEQPALAAVHTVFMREHNRLASELNRVNPHWDDDKIYHEGRRILSAINQHIAYNEFLPRLLGPGIINAYGLGLQMEGYYTGYDPNCRGIALNEFATAAFRFGHSLIRPDIARMDNRFNGMAPHIKLRDGFFDSDMLYKPLMIDEIIRGLVAEPMEQLDPFVTNEITNHLFEDNKRAFSGLDLIALNLHRGRDHGLPSYNQYREICNLKKAIGFLDLLNEVPTEVVNRLQHVYSSPDDIDLFTGALVERAVPGGIVGPTIACIVGTQFQRLRKCDRYWYETNDPSIRFTDQQLAEIRKMTLSKIICDNLDMSSDMQINSFDAPHKILNPRMPCDRMSKVNLDAWREFLPNTPPLPSAHYQGPDCIIGQKRVPVGSGALSSPCTSCVCTSDQGAKCTSLKITSCDGLMRAARREEIFNDNVCMEQCGFMMGTLVHENQISFGSGRNLRINHRSRLRSY